MNRKESAVAAVVVFVLAGILYSAEQMGSGLSYGPVPGATELYKPGTGPHETAFESGVILHDAVRGKDLSLRVTFPVEEGSYPVLLWSHKVGGCRDDYQNLIKHWASHGYVCIQCDHIDSRLIPEDQRGDNSDWDTRPPDLSFIIDSLGDIEAFMAGLAGRIDSGKIAAGGHLIGAGTADLMSGAVSGDGRAFLDSRISAALMICPQGVGQHLAVDSWISCALPRMVVVGTNCPSLRTGNPWYWRADPVRRSPQSAEGIQTIIGADPDFGGIFGTEVEHAEQLARVRSISTAFFDANVKGYADAQAYLAGSPAASASGQPLSGFAPLSVDLTGSGTGGSTEEYVYNWEFGDLSRTSQQNTDYIYENAGSYTAVFTVSDNALSGTVFLEIEVLGTGSDLAFTIEVDGLIREYLLHLPAGYDGSAQSPLVLALHQGGTTPVQMAALSGFSSIADREGFITVYPAGVKKVWNDGRFTSEDAVDDVKFISELIHKLHSQFNVDPSRIYSCGMCRGSMMSHYLGEQMAGTFAAIGAVGASMPKHVAEAFAPDLWNVSVMVIHGTDDTITPWDGNMSLASIPETVSVWVGYNGCPEPPAVEYLPDVDPGDGTLVRQETYGKGRSGVRVELLAVEGGGHTWPGTEHPLYENISGVISRDIEASEEIWRFFRDNPKYDLYKRPAGPHGVEFDSTVVLNDTVRGKDLSLRVSWPADGGPYPLLLFSHGRGGNRNDYQPFIQPIVQHGYVCIQCDHSDSDLIPEEERGDLTDWKNRPKDISFILDSLDTIENAIHALTGKIDRSRVGIAGHSYGANTTQLIGGVTTVAGENFGDPRVSALVMISPQGIGEMLGPDSWDTLIKEMLLITGTKDGPTRTGQPWYWRTEPYWYAASHEKYLQVIPDADHGFGGFTGREDNDPEWDYIDSQKQIDLVRCTALALFDAVLKDIPYARTYLNSRPCADGAAEPDAGVVPLAVEFSGYARARHGGALECFWDFTDGSEGIRERSPFHVFQTAGNRRAVFNVFDGRLSGTDLVKVAVRISNFLPEAVDDQASVSALSPDYDLSSIDSFLTDALPRYDNGCAVILIKDGRTVYRRTFGNWTFDRIVPVASASKWFSGGVIMALTDEGSLSLDETAALYFDSFQGSKAGMTVRQMFSHTHGFPEKTPPDFDPPDYLPHRDSSLASIREAVDIIAAVPLVPDCDPPGSALYYSGMGMQVAGRIAEIRMGRSWTEIFDEKMAGPLGLLHTSYYAYGETGNPNVAGSVETCIDDYGAFVWMIANKGMYQGVRVLSEAAAAQMLQNQSGSGPVVRQPWQPMDEYWPGAGSWRYGIGCWLEGMDPETGEAWEASSGGAFGCSPFVDLKRNMAGVFLPFSRNMKLNSQGEPYNDAHCVYMEMKQLVKEAIPEDIIIDVLTNDSDADYDPLTVVSVSLPSHGTAVSRSTYITYTPDIGYTGTDTFTYTVSDGNSGTDTATVTVNVRGQENEAPEAENSVAAASVNTDCIITMQASDTDGDLLVYSVQDYPLHGTLASDDGDDTVVYIPDTDYIGTDSFTFLVNDGTADSNSATVTVTVTDDHDGNGGGGGCRPSGSGETDAAAVLICMTFLCLGLLKKASLACCIMKKEVRK